MVLWDGGRSADQEVLPAGRKSLGVLRHERERHVETGGMVGECRIEKAKVDGDY